MHDEYAALLRSIDVMRRTYRSLALETARVMREIAVTRCHVARSLECLAEGAPEDQASRLRNRARRLHELATRARRFAEREEMVAARGRERQEPW
jgi:hypothetical protein